LKHPLESKARLKPAGPAIDRRKTSRSAVRDGGMQRVTVKLPPALIERARDAVAASPELTLTALVERSLTTYIDKLERQRGGAFPARKQPLRVGRPPRVK
jgi:hypothetical protein